MQNLSHPHDTERLLSVSAVLRILNIPRHRLIYLFESKRLKAEDFLTLDNGHRVFRQSDLEKIKKALFEVSHK
ncbi:MAG: hypothetical protein DYG83_10330 [Candidatus Brocadia sp. AMX2]|uniref:HTH merR-type domain-containing protein n=1 Tax=Candidatus Brocadia sinica JPN1 TaxID=1197129 RepID=A0ABQ0JY87_9BACT|nr:MULTISPECIES: hypothetical protein [Brocadia]MBC6932879.1 hypothetical protein [Candidatus Brocadia sp.]MBL1167635.1 hypothetical protein [Candidatus Brocadia sp. AMX1]NOG40473.1 hypothetical protein [Planctomycetota bacterium]NUO06275.1 hypothetical protein [Candidatus Brocadia sinica]KAA0242096.1 MAG: hypothetical protein EDM70_15730 [Candidatus Brocadia sp. AMX2]